MKSNEIHLIGGGKKRIEWIDTAKGFCILFVILQHASLAVGCDYPLSREMITLRMPLYFLISGLFFKTYSGFFDFFIKKINKLVVPYIFWYVTLGVIIPVGVWEIFNFQITGYDFYGLSGVLFIFSEEVIVNAAIWFLWCLFLVNIIFYTLNIITQKDSKKLILLSFIIGGIGLMLSIFKIDIPYYLDTALSATPIFCFGWYLRKHTGFLELEYSTKKSILILVLIFVYFFLLHYASNGSLFWRLNYFGGYKGCLIVYPLGIIGTLAILSISRIVGLLSIVSYLGRYSIIVLCTHAYCINALTGILSNHLTNKPLILFLVFIITSFISIPVIALCKKYLPWFTAQKDLINVKKIN